ncbi:MAG: aminotransferase class V-fold PLP-dependent enzyme [Chitinophagales bacterium]|nr:aminotransferase class V-fold PLP-dependent enzyme [Chitinophagales bacterium]
MSDQPKITYLNTSATGLLPEEFTKEANELYRNLAVNSSTYAERWREEFEPRLRSKVAEFLNAPVAQIALLPNFSWGMNGIVQTLKGTERVLLYKNDYPSLVEPFKINGFTITWVADDGFAIDMEAVKQKITNREIDVLAISHVQWMSGYKLNLMEIGTLCKQHGVLFIVDATQSMGAMPIDLSALDVDVFIASNYKWMNAGFGTGIMYVAESLLEKYTPAIGGHNSYVQVGDEWKYMPSARSFEPGHVNMYGFTVLYSAIEHKLAIGLGNIEAHNRKLAEQLINGIKDTSATLVGPDSYENRCSIVFLKDENGLWEKLQSAGIVASQRGGNIRFGIHYYNTEDDVKSLLDCLM